MHGRVLSHHSPEGRLVIVQWLGSGCRETRHKHETTTRHLRTLQLLARKNQGSRAFGRLY